MTAADDAKALDDTEVYRCELKGWQLDLVTEVSLEFEDRFEEGISRARTIEYFFFRANSAYSRDAYGFLDE